MLKQLNKPLKFGVIVTFSVILTLGFSISLQSLIAAWTAPISTPPTNNIADFVVGGKLGVVSNTLIMGNLAASGTKMALFANTATGQVGVGIIAPNANTTLQINPQTSMEGIRIISAANYSPLNIRNNSDTNDLFRINQNGDVLARGMIQTTDGTRTLNLYQYLGNNFVDSSGGKLYIRNTNGVNIADNGGNVGIGKDAPIGKLDIQSNSATTPLIVYGGGNLGVEILRIYKADNTEVMRINSAGNVGIGINTPTQKLDVSGNIRATDVCTVSGKCLSAMASGGGSCFWTTYIAYTSTDLSRECPVGYYMAGLKEQYADYGAHISIKCCQF